MEIYLTVLTDQTDNNPDTTNNTTASISAEISDSALTLIYILIGAFLAIIVVFAYFCARYSAKKWKKKKRTSGQERKRFMSSRRKSGKRPECHHQSIFWRICPCLLTDTSEHRYNSVDIDPTIAKKNHHKRSISGQKSVPIADDNVPLPDNAERDNVTPTDESGAATANDPNAGLTPLPSPIQPPVPPNAAIASPAKTISTKSKSTNATTESLKTSGHKTTYKHEHPKPADDKPKDHKHSVSKNSTHHEPPIKKADDILASQVAVHASSQPHTTKTHATSPLVSEIGTPTPTVTSSATASSINLTAPSSGISKADLHSKIADTEIKRAKSYSAKSKASMSQIEPMGSTSFETKTKRNLRDVKLTIIDKTSPEYRQALDVARTGVTIRQRKEQQQLQQQQQQQHHQHQHQHQSQHQQRQSPSRMLTPDSSMTTSTVSKLTGPLMSNADTKQHSEKK